MKLLKKIKNWNSTFIWQPFIYELVFNWQWSADEHEADLSSLIRPISNTPNSKMLNNKKLSWIVSFMIFQNLKGLDVYSFSSFLFWKLKYYWDQSFEQAYDKLTAISENIRLSKQCRVSPSAGKPEIKPPSEESLFTSCHPIITSHQRDCGMFSYPV